MYSYVTLFRYIAKSNYWGEDTANLHNVTTVALLCVGLCMYYVWLGVCTGSPICGFVYVWEFVW